MFSRRWPIPKAEAREHLGEPRLMDQRKDTEDACGGRHSDAELATSNSGPSPLFHCIVIKRTIQESW
jgi:hypothetical protein